MQERHPTARFNDMSLTDFIHLSSRAVRAGGWIDQLYSCDGVTYCGVVVIPRTLCETGNEIAAVMKG